MSITQLFAEYGVFSFEDAQRYVQQLPYGRNANREDFSLVLSEQKGTCSSKHALLKLFADELGLKNVSLIMGIYQMNDINTPRIGDAIKNHGLTYIPEAHCYLLIDKNRMDITSTRTNFEVLQKYLLEEREIKPLDVAENKIIWHKDYLKKWIVDTDINFSLDVVWKIREQCIAALTHS